MEVSEGLLQKKIDYYAFGYEDVDARDGKRKPTGSKVIGKDVILQIIGEAHKNCPLNPIVEAFAIYKELENHTDAEKQVVIKEHLKNCNLERFILETIDWFVKYFGEADTHEQE